MSSWQQKAKRALIVVVWLVASLVIVGPPVLAVVTRLVYGSWPAWSGIAAYTDAAGEFHPPKTAWDVWELLVIPLVLAVGVYWLNKQERDAERKAEKRRAETERKRQEQRAQTEREIAAERERENALQAYLDYMTELMLKEGLRTSEPESEARHIARVRTLTALRILDGKRKGILLLFLYESGLIAAAESGRVISLAGADFNETELRWATLDEVDLRKVDLSQANLYGAKLRRSCLQWVGLRGANLEYANLNGADLEWANLYGATLINAKLNQAKLCDATLTLADLRYNTELDTADLCDANLRGADLRSATLSNAKLCKAQLDEHILHVDEAEVQRAIRYGAEPCEVTLGGSTRLAAKIHGANLSQANLQNADLSGAYLYRARLRKTDLRSAELVGTDLHEADVANAILKRANLYKASVTDEQLAQAWSLKDATMPTGSRYDGRFNLEGDAQEARRDGIDVDDPEAMARELHQSRC